MYISLKIVPLLYFHEWKMDKGTCFSCGFRGKFHPDQLTKVGKKAKVEHFPNSKDLEFQIGTSKGPLILT